jgi:hypothetical protein
MASSALLGDGSREPSRRHRIRRIFRLAGLHLRARRRGGPGSRRRADLWRPGTASPQSAGFGDHSVGCRQLQAGDRYSPGTCEAGSRDTPGPVCLAQSGVSRNQVTVRPPRRRQPHLAARAATSSSPRPLSASPPAGRSRGTPGPPRSVTSIRTRPSPAVTATVTVPPGSPRAAVPDAVAEQLAHQQDRGILARVPRASTPPVKARATRARSASPASVTLSRTAAPPIRPPPSRPARPGGAPGTAADTDGCTLSSAPHVKPRPPRARGPQAGTYAPTRPVRGRPWKSRRCIPAVRTVHTDRPDSTDARPLYVRGQRTTTVYSATR